MTMKEEQSKKLFWLDDLQGSIVEPHLPTKQTGPKRKDDRRIISGGIHVRQSGCRGQDCPPAYGPGTTVYTRYHRWAKGQAGARGRHVPRSDVHRGHALRKQP